MLDSEAVTEEPADVNKQQSVIVIYCRVTNSPS